MQREDEVETEGSSAEGGGGKREDRGGRGMEKDEEEEGGEGGETEIGEREENIFEKKNLDYFASSSSSSSSTSSLSLSSSASSDSSSMSLSQIFDVEGTIGEVVQFLQSADIRSVIIALQVPRQRIDHFYERICYRHLKFSTLQRYLREIHQTLSRGDDGRGRIDCSGSLPTTTTTTTTNGSSSSSSSSPSLHYSLPPSATTESADAEKDADASSLSSSSSSSPFRLLYFRRVHSKFCHECGAQLDRSSSPASILLRPLCFCFSCKTKFIKRRNITCQFEEVQNSLLYFAKFGIKVDSSFLLSTTPISLLSLFSSSSSSSSPSSSSSSSECPLPLAHGGLVVVKDLWNDLWASYSRKTKALLGKIRGEFCLELKEKYGVAFFRHQICSVYPPDCPLEKSTSLLSKSLIAALVEDYEVWRTTSNLCQFFSMMKKLRQRIDDFHELCRHPDISRVSRMVQDYLNCKPRQLVDRTALHSVYPYLLRDLLFCENDNLRRVRFGRREERERVEKALSPFVLQEYCLASMKPEGDSIQQRNSGGVWEVEEEDYLSSNDWRKENTKTKAEGNAKSDDDDDEKKDRRERKENGKIFSSTNTFNTNVTLTTTSSSLLLSSQPLCSASSSSFNSSSVMTSSSSSTRTSSSTFLSRLLLSSSLSSLSQSTVSNPRGVSQLLSSVDPSINQWSLHSEGGQRKGRLEEGLKMVGGRREGRGEGGGRGENDEGERNEILKRVRKNSN